MADPPSAAELEARILALTTRRPAGGTPRTPATAGETAEDVAMSVASGGARGATGLAGSFADTLNTLSQYLPAGGIPFFPSFGRPSLPGVTAQQATAAAPQIPGTTEDVRNVTAAVVPGARTLFDYRPTTDLGRYAQTGTEWALPAVIAGPGGIVRRALTGGAGGIAAQGATDVSHAVVPGQYRPYVDPVVGATAGLLTIGRLNRPMVNRTNPSAVVGEATRDVSPADWARAQARIDAAEAAGFRLLPAEALGDAGVPLQGITSDIAASRAGGPIQQVFGARQGQALTAGEQAIAAVGGPEAQVANTVRNVSAGARGVVQDARTVRTRAADPGYEAARNEPVQQGQFNVVFNRAGASFSPSSPLAGELRALMAEVNDARNMAQVDSTYRRIRDMAREARAADPGSERARMLGDLAAGLNRELLTGSPGIAAGRAAFRANVPLVEELRQPELLGRLQKALLEEGSVPAALQRQLDVIHGATQSPQEIARVFSVMSLSRQPQAVRDLGAILLRRELNTAARVAPTSPDAPLTGARLWSALMETPDTARRTEAVIRGMAQAGGANPDQAWQGFSRLLDVFAQTGRIPAVGSRTAPREALARAMGGNWASTLLDTANVTRGSALRNASTWFAERAARADYADLARALSRPDGLQVLRDMAGQIPNSPRAQAAAQRFLELAPQAGEAARDRR